MQQMLRPQRWSRTIRRRRAQNSQRTPFTLASAAQDLAVPCQDFGEEPLADAAGGGLSLSLSIPKDHGWTGLHETQGTSSSKHSGDWQQPASPVASELLSPTSENKQQVHFLSKLRAFRFHPALLLDELWAPRSFGRAHVRQHRGIEPLGPSAYTSQRLAHIDAYRR